jgi:hypothetical protein
VSRREPHLSKRSAKRISPQNMQSYSLLCGRYQSRTKPSSHERELITL